MMSLHDARQVVETREVLKVTLARQHEGWPAGTEFYLVSEAGPRVERNTLLPLSMDTVVEVPAGILQVAR